MHVHVERVSLQMAALSPLVAAGPQVIGHWLDSAVHNIGSVGQ